MRVTMPPSENSYHPRVGELLRGVLCCWKGEMMLFAERVVTIEAVHVLQQVIVGDFTDIFTDGSSRCGTYEASEERTHYPSDCDASRAGNRPYASADFRATEYSGNSGSTSGQSADSAADLLAIVDFLDVERVAGRTFQKC